MLIAASWPPTWTASCSRTTCSSRKTKHLPYFPTSTLTESSIPVPWISALPPLTIGLRRAEVIAFWTVAIGVLVLFLGLTAKAWGSTAPWSWAGSGVVVLFPGIVWRPWFEFGVRGWNKGVRWLTAAMRAYVLRVCYYVVLNSVGQTGSA